MQVLRLGWAAPEPPAFAQDDRIYRSQQEGNVMSTNSISGLASIIGNPTPRIDGPLKTTGTAEYSADFHFERMAYAVPVCATIPSGRIAKLDAADAEKLPGV